MNAKRVSETILTPQPREAIDILLVEDNPGDVRLIQEAFTTNDSNTTLHTVANSDEALAFISERQESDSTSLPDIILLDLNLPGEDGFAVLEGIEDDPELPPLPILVLTNSKDDADVVKSYELSASAYLTKPAAPDDFDLLAERVIDFWVEKAKLPPE